MAMTSNSTRGPVPVLSVDHVTVESTTGEKLSDCKLVLSQNEIICIEGVVTKLTVPLTRMKAIDVHQPIFGANYITGEFVDQGYTHTITMTFSKGGATDFARAFFQLTEGRLVTEVEQQYQSTAPTQPPEQDKKNK